MDFTEIIGSLEDFGVYEVLLPFILVFVLTFAVLEKVKIFGEGGRRFNAIIALVIAFFFIRNQTLVSITLKFLPKVSMFIIIVLMVLIITSFFLGKSFTSFGGGMVVFFTIIAIIVVLWLYAETAGGGTGVWEWVSDNISEDDIKLLVGLAAALGVIFYVLKGRPSDALQQPQEKKGGP